MQVSYQETEELMEILRARSNLEVLYSNDLRNLGIRLNKYADDKQNSLNDAYCALRSFFSIHSELCQNFSKQLNSDILENLNKYLATSKEDLKNYISLSKQNENQLKKLEENKAKAKQKYIKQMMKTKTVIRENAKSTLKTEDALKRQNENLDLAEKFKHLQEEKLKEVIEDYNTFLDEYFTNNAKISEFFINDQMLMKQNLKDSIMKLIVYEISIIRGMQYDLEKITKKVEAYNPNSEKFELFYEDSTDKSKPFLTKINFESWLKNFHEVNFPSKEKKGEEEKDSSSAQLKKTGQNVSETQEMISKAWSSMMKFMKKKEEPKLNDDKIIITMEYLKNLSKNLKNLSEFFSNNENQIQFLKFLQEVSQKELVENTKDLEIIIMIFCSQAKKTKDYANILTLLDIAKNVFPKEMLSVYQDHDLWFSYVNIALESKILKNLNEPHIINFKKGSSFNEILHDIFRKMLAIGFKTGFLMEILKDLEKKYVFDSLILAEFREILKENLKDQSQTELKKN